MSLDDIRKERIKKLEILRERGIDPYPAKSNREISIGELRADFSSYKETEPRTVAGRVMAIRGHGGSVFIDLFDGTGKIQGYLKQDAMSESVFSLFTDTVDIGDFIEITGTPVETKRGEKSILASNWAMLTKSLRPLPEKWHGIQDVEERLRHRYLDILFNEDVREIVRRKAIFWQAVRQFMLDHGFLEVETPALEITTGGADARPFVTHHNALDVDVYLRISAGELWQKELLVAGFPKIFEIGRIFRNEGISPEHSQDYTQMEFYWAYADYQDGMGLTENLFRHIAEAVWGTLEFTINGHTVNLGKPWERYDYREMVLKYTDIDPLDTTLERIEAKLEDLGVKHEKKGWNHERATDALWKHTRKLIAGPGFLIGVPKELSPLAKASPENSRVVERFQTIIGGTELSNGYSELNDPLDQKERFVKQQAMREAGDEEAQMMNEDFIEALEYGMPPACGFGMSERVFSVLSGIPLREAQIFPLMRPRE